VSHSFSTRVARRVVDVVDRVVNCVQQEFPLPRRPVKGRERDRYWSTPSFFATCPKGSKDTPGPSKALQSCGGWRRQRATGQFSARPGFCFACARRLSRQQLAAERRPSARSLRARQRAGKKGSPRRARAPPRQQALCTRR
jgi:hypothetical protein